MAFELDIEKKLQRAAKEASGCVEFIKLARELGVDYTYWRERAINVLANALTTEDMAAVGDPKREIEFRSRLQELFVQLNAEVRGSAR